MRIKKPYYNSSPVKSIENISITKKNKIWYYIGIIVFIIIIVGVVIVYKNYNKSNISGSTTNSKTNTVTTQKPIVNATPNTTTTTMAPTTTTMAPTTTTMVPTTTTMVPTTTTMVPTTTTMVPTTTIAPTTTTTMVPVTTTTTTPDLIPYYVKNNKQYSYQKNIIDGNYYFYPLSNTVSIDSVTVKSVTIKLINSNSNSILKLSRVYMFDLNNKPITINDVSFTSTSLYSNSAPLNNLFCDQNINLTSPSPCSTQSVTCVKNSNGTVYIKITLNIPTIISNIIFIPDNSNFFNSLFIMYIIESETSIIWAEQNAHLVSGSGYPMKTSFTLQQNFRLLREYYDYNNNSYSKITYNTNT